MAPTQIEGWDNFPLVDWCRDTFGLSAALVNDSDSAGLAEARFGAGRGGRVVFYSNVGSGIGGARPKSLIEHEEREWIAKFNRDIDLVINTPLGRESHVDDAVIRQTALKYDIPCITTLAGAATVISALEAARRGRLLDRRGRVIAVSTRGHKLFIDPQVVVDAFLSLLVDRRQRVAQLLAQGFEPEFVDRVHDAVLDGEVIGGAGEDGGRRVHPDARRAKVQDVGVGVAADVVPPAADRCQQIVFSGKLD